MRNRINDTFKTYSHLDFISMKEKTENQILLRYISRKMLGSITYHISDFCELPFVSEKDLIKQVLLHRPRFSEEKLHDFSFIFGLIQTLSRRLLSLRAQYVEFYPRLEIHSLNPDETYFCKVSPETAKIIHERFHYLESFRADGIHLGLYYIPEKSLNPKLMGLATISKFDLINIKSKLPFGICTEEVRVLSRIFVFDWVPRNTVSYLIGGTFSWLRKNLPFVKILLTYSNPNLGFSGTVYKATNWLFFGKEKNNRFLYLDSNYATERFVRKLYGTSNFHELRASLGNRISSSIQTLLPLDVYIYFIDPALRRTHKSLFNFEFDRS
ncbi:MAG: hypothetical protein ACFFDN_39360 [Candidatus Hodarchaeota archaeon]